MAWLGTNIDIRQACSRGASGDSINSFSFSDPLSDPLLQHKVSGMQEDTHKQVE